ncbi:hypothetical protein AVEN_14270-1 [Araneus ventricosus]|uniref:Uncharacterized protein n=1 Tax=Araneus ventricosus TaxID=182803 RepID=A0A4Y2KD43_ARAVE|nr:hypothetical protein AVEN_14270-1 [Araneus ventricosus]
MDGYLSTVPTDCCRLCTRRRNGATGRIPNDNKPSNTTSSNQVIDCGNKALGRNKAGAELILHARRDGTNYSVDSHILKRSSLSEFPFWHPMDPIAFLNAAAFLSPPLQHVDSSEQVRFPH